MIVIALLYVSIVLLAVAHGGRGGGEEALKGMASLLDHTDNQTRGLLRLYEALG